MFAIVDIETTGGNAKFHKITEVAVCVHDGEKVLSTYETLVNPEMHIPHHIERLTGINNDMVADAPTFTEIADELYEQLEGHVFVAHNVAFDYGFIKNHFAEVDVKFSPKRLCTVRLSRKVFPGLPSYSLGKLAKSLDLTNHARHRAMGDAAATAQLFTKLVAQDQQGFLQQHLHQRSGETRIPPHLPKEAVTQLPEAQGIYYFKNQLGQVLYVGKSQNIKKRVLEHFTLNSSTQRRTKFAEEIHQVDHQVLYDPLITALMECHEIKRHWPRYNREYKKRSKAYGIYAYQDQNGCQRLYMNQLLHKSKPELVFGDYVSAYNFLKKQSEEAGMCPKLFGLDIAHQCENDGANCDMTTEPDLVGRSQKLLEQIRRDKPTYAIKGMCTPLGWPVVLVHQGHYKGWGFVPEDMGIDRFDTVYDFVAPYKENIDVHRILESHLAKVPESRVAADGIMNVLC